MEYIERIFWNNTCVYCHAVMDKEHWRSEWGERDEHHYKTIHCSCGRKNWAKVHFPGSGHDLHFKKHTIPLESSVRKVQEK